MINSRKLFNLHFKTAIKVIFWFSLGAALGLFFFVSFVFFMYQQTYKNLVYPGIIINGVDFGGKSEGDVRTSFATKNKAVENSSVIFKADGNIASVSAKALNIGYDERLVSKQAVSLGRSDNFIP